MSEGFQFERPQFQWKHLWFGLNSHFMVPRYPDVPLEYQTMKRALSSMDAMHNHIHVFSGYHRPTMWSHIGVASLLL